MLPVVLVAVVLAGCGTEKLTDDEDARYDKLSLEISLNNLNSSGDYGYILDGVDWLVQLCRKKPDAARAKVEDAASELQDYEPDLADKLDRALDGSCG